MKKMGLISLALVLALGALGVGYAAWWDDAEIVQAVQTGSLQIGVHGEAELVGDHKNVASLTVTHHEWKLSKVYFGETLGFHQSVTVALGNWYPCVEAREYFKIGVGGSIPLYLDVSLDVDDDGLFDHMIITWYMSVLRDGEFFDTHYGSGTANLELPKIAETLGCRQYYPCDVVVLELYKHLPQSDTQNRYAEFTITVTGIQYNKYEKIPPQAAGKETAMADGHKYPNHSWFMYTPYDPDNGTTADLIAAQHYKVGTVHFSAADDDTLTITITLDPGHSFFAGETKVSVKGYTSKAAADGEKNWPFCTWPYDGHVDPAETSFSFEVPAFDEDDEPYSFYAVHVNIAW